MTSNLEWKIQNLPESPGCYLMKSKGEIIYVGKAKNLKNRVRQYFHASANHTAKVRAMVEKVDDFDIVLVDGELEALILEFWASPFSRTPRGRLEPGNQGPGGKIQENPQPVLVEEIQVDPETFWRTS